MPGKLRMNLRGDMIYKPAIAYDFAVHFNDINL